MDASARFDEGWLRKLPRHRLLDLTTFRASGEPVTTPVRYAVDGGRLVVSLQSDSGKVKRAAANQSVRVAGHPHGAAREGTLRLLEGQEARGAALVLRRQHRLLFVQRLILGRHPSRHRMAEIVPRPS